MGTVSLEWQGPFHLGTAESRQTFDPPHQPGVYMWCVGGPEALHPAYIGQSMDIEARLYQHIVSIIGGAYVLYSDAHLRSAEPAERHAIYQPNLHSILGALDDDRHFERVRAHLDAYRFFWATAQRGREELMAIESGLNLICAAAHEPLENRNVSRKSEHCVAVTVLSTFAAGVRVAGIPPSLTYGTARVE